MARQRDLKNAPITEAIIDIRVKLPKSFEIDPDNIPPGHASIKEWPQEKDKGRELNKLNKYFDLTSENQYFKKLECPS